MENRYHIHFFGLFALTVFTIISFSMGNLMIINFVTHPEVNHYMYSWLPFLGTTMFIVGYVVRLFSAQNPIKYRLIFFAGMILPLIVLILSQTLFRDPPERILLIAGGNYYYAGMICAWASDRFRTLVKI